MSVAVKNPDDLFVQLEIMENILNNMNIAVYVSDLATNKVLYTNMALQQLLDNHLLTGRLCWEALKNKNKRCESCKIPYLLKNPGKECHWEMHTEDSRFQVYDSIIPWVEDRLAHMQYRVELSASYNKQRHNKGEN